MGAPESLGEFWDFEKFLIILGNSSVILGNKMFIWRFFVIYPYFLIILEIFRYLSIFFLLFWKFVVLFRKCFVSSVNISSFLEYFS